MDLNPEANTPIFNNSRKEQPNDLSAEYGGDIRKNNRLFNLVF